MGTKCLYKCTSTSKCLPCGDVFLVSLKKTTYKHELHRLKYSENIEMQMFPVSLGVGGGGICSLYSIKIIMFMGSPNKASLCMCMCVCTCMRMCVYGCK